MTFKSIVSRSYLLLFIFLGLSLSMIQDLSAQVFARSPEVHENRTITFRYFAPNAKEVMLQGNVPEIKGKLEKGSDGVWSITVGPLAPDTYPYKFVVDKSVVLDPVNRQIKAWIWMENVVDVPANPAAGEHPAIHQLQDVPHGSVHQHWYQSPRLKQTRSLYVYTPPGYHSGDDSFPVLYLLHGFGDDQSAWTRVGMAHQIADNVLASGKSKPAIVVMPLGHIAVPDDPDYRKANLMDNLIAMENELLEGVMPFVESNYRCKTDRQHRGIAGLSMGGGQTLHIGINNSDKFGWIAGFSSSIVKQKVDELAIRKLAELKQNAPWLWLGCGKDDFLFADTTSFDKWMTDNNVEHTTRITEGAHNWRCWRRYLEEVLGEMFVEK